MKWLRLLSRKEWLVIITLLAVIASATTISIVSLTGDRQNAVSSLYSNCDTIEQIKRFIRETSLRQNKLNQQLHIRGFGPLEKAVFQKQVDETLRIFKPQDCRKLPLVKGS